MVAQRALEISSQCGLQRETTGARTRIDLLRELDNHRRRPPEVPDTLKIGLTRILFAVYNFTARMFLLDYYEQFRRISVPKRFDDAEILEKCCI